MVSRGALVRYEMPALPSAFPQLSRILDGSTHRAQFFGIHYHIKSRDGRIERLLPAAEYYECVFRAVADKRHALELGRRAITDAATTASPSDPAGVVRVRRVPEPLVIIAAGVAGVVLTQIR